MPIYEYICQDCGAKYEKFVRSSTAQVELICPMCGSLRSEKALSLFGALGGSSKADQTFGPARSAPACGPIG